MQVRHSDAISGGAVTEPSSVDPTPSESAPFACGSVSLRLYPHNDLPAPRVIAELCHQAHMAADAGFDGIMTSEHHGGFPGYLPNPLQVVGFILEDSPVGWAAACPLLLPLRPAAMVAEEVAWLAARHPGRVGLGVAAGALPLDFEVMGMRATSAAAAFKADLPRLVAMLEGRDLGRLGGDPALPSMQGPSDSGGERGRLCHGRHESGPVVAPAS